MRKTLFIFLFSGCLFTASAQESGASINDTVVVKREESTMSAAPVMAKKWNQFHNKWFTMNLGFAILLDHNIVNQDNISLTQVGKVDAATQFRGDRIIATGNLLFFKQPWRYMISLNFNGLDATDDKKSLEFIDYNVEIPFGQKGGWLTVGKQKEGVGHEYVLPGTQAFFMERGVGAPSFIRQRNIGIRYSNSVLNNRLTYTLGFFNNFMETGKSFADNGSQITFRTTGLPIYTSDRDLMHISVGYRHTGATDGKLSFKAKPEVNSAPSYINTGSFDAKAADILMFEWIKVNGPVSFIGEYMINSVSSVSTGHPTFNYWQFGGSWFLTGENRRYNKQNGNLGKLIPKKNFKFKNGSGPGAFELGARYTQENLTAGTLDGGKFSRFSLGLSWYPNAHFRYVIDYGQGILEKSKLKGVSDFWQFRIQFEL